MSSNGTGSPKMMRGAKLVALYVLAIAIALALSALLIAVTGGPWRKVFTALIDGSVRKPGRWGDTLAESAPLLIVALGAIISTRAGLVNIGQEGQLAVGAATATYVATQSSGPFVLVLALLGGVVGGAVWAGIAALLKYWRKVPEVISTLLLVFIASQGTGYLLTRTFLLLDDDPNKPNRVQTSAQLDADTRIGFIRIFGNAFPWSVVLAVVLAVVVSVLLSRSTWGFRLTVLGRNPRTAQRIGVPVVLAGASALMLSGAFAGLAGATMLAAGTANYRYTPGFANNVGWEGLLVALVARNRPLACIPVALVFGALRTGSGFLAATGVERSIVDVVRSLLVLALLVPPAIVAIQRRRVSPPPAPVSTDEPVVAVAR
ncbi:MAG: ABC transporter permease [Actinobacteria bacterium]|nr:ABC transporter permease [Actinomycetota bacterium]